MEIEVEFSMRMLVIQCMLIRKNPEYGSLCNEHPYTVPYVKNRYNSIRQTNINKGIKIGLLLSMLISHK